MKEEQTTNTTQVGVRLNAELFTVIERFRVEEDRSMANMVAVLLKTHPRIQPILESEQVETA